MARLLMTGPDGRRLNDSQRIEVGISTIKKNPSATNKAGQTMLNNSIASNVISLWVLLITSYRSTSPNTRSIVPIIATASANR